MKFVIHFRKQYFFVAMLVFLSEIIIALYIHDDIIRPYIGDFLVVILIYSFLKSFLNIPVLPTAITVLLFSYAIETLQYFSLVNRLGLQHSKIARIIIGTSFEWIDMISYTAGIALVVIVEIILSNKVHKRQLKNIM